MTEQNEYRIIRTEDWYPLAELFDESGLHADPDEPRDGDSIALWRCETVCDDDGNPVPEGSGRLIGAAELCYKAGVLVLQHIAIADEFRKRGFGEALLAAVEAYARGLDCETSGNHAYEGELWLCAKVSEFYRKYDWSEVLREESPDFTSCFECEEWGVTCRPSIMRKKL